MDFSEESQGRQSSRKGREARSDLSAQEIHALALRFSKRDPGAFEEVFRRFREAVYVIGVLELGDTEEAQDLVQETFRRAWSSAATLGDPSRLRPWLFAIARNLCVDLAKRSQRRPTPVQEVPDWRMIEQEEAAPLSQAIRNERARRVQSLLQTVPEKFRHVLALRLLQEQSYQEIATSLDMPLHGVKNSIARGGRVLWEKVRNSPDLASEGEL